MTDTRSSPGTDELWRAFNEAHDAVSGTEPGKARRAGFDAVLGMLDVAQRPVTSGETAQAIAHELFAHECFAFVGDGPKPHSHRCHQAALRLEEWRESSVSSTPRVCPTCGTPDSINCSDSFHVDLSMAPAERK